MINNEGHREIGVQPVVSWPRNAIPGGSYLISVDLRLTNPAEPWPYEDEEFAVGCMIDGRPFSTVRVIGDAGVVLHRFGGTYGPARFVAEIQADVNDFDEGEAFWLTLTTAGGVPFYTGRLPVDGSSALDGPLIEIVRVAKTADSLPSQSTKHRDVSVVGVGRRYFIAIGLSQYVDPELSDLPAVSESVAAMRALFTDVLHYQAVPGFDGNPSADAVFSLLEAFLSSPERRSDDIIATYFTGHATRNDDDFSLLFPESRLNQPMVGVSVTRLARHLTANAVVRRLLVILDTCYAGSARATLASAFGHLQIESASVAVVTAAGPSELATSGAFANAFVETVRRNIESADALLAFLSLESIVAALRHVQPLREIELTCSGEDAFLPNPRFEGARLQPSSQAIAQKHPRTPTDGDHLIALDKVAGPPTNLGLDPSRVAEVLVTFNDGAQVRLSGYRTTNNTVLTVLTDTKPAASFKVRFSHGQADQGTLQARMAWREHGSALAMLTFEARDDGPVIVPPTFGRIAESSTVASFRTAGYPVRQGSGQPTQDVGRDLEIVQGAVTRTRGDRGLVATVIAPPILQQDTERSPWEGMAGAAVWVNSCLVGVVSHHTIDGHVSLGCIPTERLFDGARRLRVELTGLIGDSILLVDAMPDPPEWWQRSLYIRQVRDIAPDPGPADRWAELTELARFCSGDEAYIWWQAGPWAGKTALMATFALNPPPNTDVISFFASGRLAAQADSTAFIEVLGAQLAAIVGEPLEPSSRSDATGRLHGERLLRQAIQQARRRGRRLVLIVDGLDEDRGSTDAGPQPSIASLLPTADEDVLRVIVSSRADPPIPSDVRLDHPLRSCRIRQLAPSPYVHDIHRRARREADLLLKGDRIQREVVSLLAASGGWLGEQDLRELTAATSHQLESTLNRLRGRVLSIRHDSSARDRPVFWFAHEMIRSLVIERLGEGDVDYYRHRIHSWAERYRDDGWPSRTPQYLLGPYTRMLAENRDTSRLVALTTDPGRHARLRVSTTSDAAALAEIDEAEQLLQSLPEPELALAEQLASGRIRLQSGQALPERLLELAEQWAATGDLQRALQFAGQALDIYGRISESNPDEFTPELAALHKLTGDVRMQLGDHETAVHSYAEALSVLRSPLAATDREAAALTDLSTALAAAGRLDNALLVIDEASGLLGAADVGPMGSPHSNTSVTAGVHAQRGRVLAALSRYADAAAALDFAIALYSTLPAAQGVDATLEELDRESQASHRSAERLGTGSGISASIATPADTPEDPWRALPQEELEALNHWLQTNSATLEFVRWLEIGNAGTLMAVADLHMPVAPSKRLIARFSLASGDQPSHAALQATPRNFQARMGVLTNSIRLLNWTLYLEEVRGLDAGTLDTLTDALSGRNLSDTCSTVVRSILADWNTSAEVRTTSVRAYLQNAAGKRLFDQRGPVRRWMKAEGIDAGRRWIARSGVPELLPNPYVLAKSGTESGEPIQILTGRAHGDLHTHNILVPMQPQQAPEQFRLVDLGRFSANAPLAQDPMRLLLSIAEDRLSSIDPGSPAAKEMLRAIVQPQPVTSDRVPDFVGVSNAIWEAGEQWVRGLGVGAEWRVQSLLALIAHAIRYVGQPLAHVRRGWYFDLACLAAQELLKHLGSEPPSGQHYSREPATLPARAIRLRDAEARHLGVHAAIETAEQPGDQPTYVPRDFDASLREILIHGAQQGCFLVLVGDSTSGKTRALYEATKATVPDWWLVHPVTSNEVREIAESPPPRTVVWMDDFARYLDHGLHVNTIRTLVAAGVMVLASMWPDHYDALTSPSERDVPSARAREILSLAQILHVPATFTIAERERAMQLASTDPRIRIALLTKDAEFTQILAAAPELVRRWQDAPDPYARALLTAAIDAYQVGVESSLSLGLLEEAVPGYLSPTDLSRAAPRWLYDALAYATTPLRSSIAPLAASTRSTVSRSGYQLADYLSQYGRSVRGNTAVPGTMWSALANHITDPDDAIRVADNARSQRRYSDAETLYRRAAQSGNGRARVRLAELLGEQGRLTEAIAELRSFADLGDSRAGILLAEMLAQQGRDEEASQVLRQYVNRGDTDVAARLATVLVRLGRLDEAIDVLRQVVLTGDASAGGQLAELLRQQGRVDEAAEVLGAMAGGGEVGVKFARPSRWDIGVITVLAVEAHAVIDVLARSGQYQASDQGGRRFHETRVPTGGQHLHVVMTRAAEPGQRSAVLAFEDLRQRYQPRIIALVGIGSGVHQDIRLGDVVIAREIVGYDGPREIATDAQRLSRRHQVPAAVLHAVNNFFDDHGDPYLLTGVDTGTGRDCLVRSGPIGSGEAIAVDGRSDLRSFLAGLDDRILAVEMEAAGVAHASWEGLAERTVAGLLVIHGIADVADSAKESGYHEIAARHAAAALLRLLPYLGASDR